MSTVKQPETKTIAGMECYGREKAAAYIGMCLSSLDKLVRLTRLGKARVPVKFIQYTKSAPIWFPKEWLDSYVLDVMNKGRAY